MACQDIIFNVDYRLHPASECNEIREIILLDYDSKNSGDFYQSSDPSETKIVKTVRTSWIRLRCRLYSAYFAREFFSYVKVVVNQKDMPKFNYLNIRFHFDAIYEEETWSSTLLAKQCVNLRLEQESNDPDLNEFNNKITAALNLVMLTAAMGALQPDCNKAFEETMAQLFKSGLSKRQENNPNLEVAALITGLHFLTTNLEIAHWKTLNILMDPITDYKWP